MEADPYLWVVLVMREDYLAGLDPYAHLLSNRLRARFYMQRMSADAALEAVKMPVAEVMPFDSGVAERLVENLRLINVGKDETGNPVLVMDEFVEPVQLQVVCYQLWEQLHKDSHLVAEERRCITREDLDHLSEDGNLVGFITSALAGFYEQSLKNVLEVMQSSGKEIGERELRGWFTNELITEGETRGLVFQGDDSTGSLPNQAVRLLEQQFIIRSETRAGGKKWYELVHDRFVSPILQSNKTWEMAHPLPPERGFEETVKWEASHKNPNYLLEGRHLEEAQVAMQRNPEKYIPADHEFINVSKSAWDHKQTSRERKRLLIFTFVLLLLAGAFLFSYFKTLQIEYMKSASATSEAFLRDSAATKSANADQSNIVAATANALASGQEAVASTAQAQGQVQATLAAVAREQAIASKANLTANQVSMQALLNSGREDLEALLNVAAMKISPNWFTRSVFYSTLKNIQNKYPPAETGQDQILVRSKTEVLFSPDGKMLVTVGEYGRLEAFRVDLSGQTSGKVIDVKQTKIPGIILGIPKLRTHVFSPSGQFLALGDEDGRLWVWDTHVPYPLGIHKTATKEPDAILSIAFSPDEKQLAFGTLKGKVVFIEIETANWKLINQYSLPITGLAWSNSSQHQRLAVGTEFGQISWYDPVGDARGKLTTSPQNGPWMFSQMAWSRSDDALFIMTVDGNLYKFRASDGKIIGEYRSSQKKTMTLSQDGRWLALVEPMVSNSEPGKATILDTGSLLTFTTLYQDKDHPSWVQALAFTQRKEMPILALSKAEDNLNQVSGWPEMPSTTAVVSGQVPAQVVDMQVGENGKPVYLVVPNSAGSNAAQPSDTYQLVNENNQPMGEPVYVRHPILQKVNGQVVILGLNDAGAVVLRAAAENQDNLPPSFTGLGAVEEAVIPLAIDGAGKNLVVVRCDKDAGGKTCQSQYVELWNLERGKLDDRLHLTYTNPAKTKILSAVFQPDGQRLFLGTSDGNLLFIDLSNPESLAKITSAESQAFFSQDPVSRLVLSTDGKLLVGSGSAPRLYLWGPEEEKVFGVIYGPEGVYIPAGITFSGEKITTVSGYGQVLTWDVSFDTWINRACEIAGRDISLAERDTYLGEAGNIEVCPQEGQAAQPK
jgi:WD40 repeat protein